ncbi:MAG: acyloxyacyl hydrolase [Chthoniobacterales bacterium]|nr:acyloxyacyl hydrolase [Chthoniobacterales bacterium]
MKNVFVAFALTLIAPGGVQAGVEEPGSLVARQEAESNFARGEKEFQNVTGAFFYFDTGPNNRPSIDYALNSLRLGVMMNDPWSLGLLSGNFEFLGEVFAGPVVEGPGNVLAGGTLVFRYNFVQPRARLIPYVQVGAGGVYSDIPEKESRGLISLPVEFNLQAGAGTRLMLNDRWSIVVEGTYRHISNAEIKKPNFGIDSVGGNLGFGFFF